MKHNVWKKKNKGRGTGLSFLATLGICLMIFCTLSCGNNNQKGDDSVDSAMNSNEQKADDSAMATNSSDADFVVKAANGGMAEVNLGKIAKEKASNPSVKEFASKMVDDHSKINDRLKAVAASLNITLPATIDKDKQDAVDKLNSAAVKDFDKDYMDMMVKAHNTDVDLFQKASKDITNADIHDFIMEALPTLQAHQKMAKQLDDSLK